MNAVILVPLVIAIVGALAYVLSTNGKVAELGRLCFGCGMLAICFSYAGHVVRIP